MNRIEEALSRKFQDHRVVFWYDEKGEFEEYFDGLSLGTIKKLKLQGNEFEIKYVINVQKPTTEFLIYSPHPKPANEENWLLDMELAYTLFQTDQES